MAAALLALGLSGCGGDGSDGYVEDPSYGAAESRTSNAACKKVSGHPVGVSVGPLESVRACSARDGRSLHVRNGSSHVLRVRPDDLYDRTAMTLLPRKEPPGIDVAHSTTGGGLDASRETFVLPLGGSMTARSDSTVSLGVEGDFDLTVVANVARYFAEWIASELPVRGEQLARPVRPCAASARQGVEDGFVEDALRHAIQTRPCRKVMDDVARENGADPLAERAKARASIFRRAGPVLREPLRSRRTTILAER